jgi:hypothetical protein
MKTLRNGYTETGGNRGDHREIIGGHLRRGRFYLYFFTTCLYLEETIASAAARTSLGNSVKNPDTMDYKKVTHVIFKLTFTQRRQKETMYRKFEHGLSPFRIS